MSNDQNVDFRKANLFAQELSRLLKEDKIAFEDMVQLVLS